MPPPHRLLQKVQRAMCQRERKALLKHRLMASFVGAQAIYRDHPAWMIAGFLFLAWASPPWATPAYAPMVKEVIRIPTTQITSFSGALDPPRTLIVSGRVCRTHRGLARPHMESRLPKCDQLIQSGPFF